MFKEKHTFHVSKCTENTSRAITRLLYVVALGALVYFGVELLLSPGVTIRTHIAAVAVARLAPFLAVFHVRTRC